MRTYCIALRTTLKALWKFEWGGNPKGGDIYLCNYLICCTCAVKKLTQHCKQLILQ